MKVREQYVYQIEGEEECGGVQTVHVVSSSETDAAQFVRDTLAFVLVNAITKLYPAWVL